ncbi:MAG: ABC transporter ATP-binding protein [Saprospiraceae bacterium]|uniref:ABC transporter ATP-binding protein n=1 Tax=Candidatus Defluviibacterium haderslevense TaxID=2981993 RepID=A0A9D7S697_9BACT|nr:ABC transporter ATP-binding protein [Candidatus Defluviibacterium haderslevense]MBL0235872.1 ABC transporter ATP-binding protein [Candidatus Defluviibacterium haderslevense]
MTQTAKNNSALLKRLFRYAKPYQLILFTSAILAVVLAPLNALTPYLTHIMVDEYIMKSDLDGLKYISLLYLLILLLTTVLRYFFVIMTNRLGQYVIHDLRNDVFRHLLSMRMSYFDKTPVGTNTTRTVSDLESVNVVFSEGLITIIADIIGLLTLLGVMFYTSIKLTLISLISMPLLILASYIFKESVKKSFQRVRNEVARMNGFLQESLSGMRIIQLFSSEKMINKKFKEINTTYTQANIDGIFYYAVFFPVVEIISAASLGFMVWWGAQGVLDQSVTIGQLVAFPMFLTRLFQPIRMLADKFNSLQMGLIASNRIFDTLDHSENDLNMGTIAPNSIKGDIQFENIMFGYQAQVPVLKSINFEVKAGTSLAIVGNTGSGKTTIISLLNRLYEFDSGNIYIDGVSIKDYDLHFLRRKMGLVLQDVFLFYGSLKDNISLFDPEISLDSIIEASIAIGAHEFIEALPGGYDYQVAERGANLSLGQRQLISFVRALVFNPDILILDEATSSVDSYTESIIQHAIKRLITKRTSIIIAHRLSTIKHADQIISLQNGKIVEKGTHEELLTQTDGLYSRLIHTHFTNN